MLVMNLFLAVLLAILLFPLTGFYAGRFLKKLPKKKRYLFTAGISLLLGCIGCAVPVLALGLLHILVLWGLTKLLHWCLGKWVKGYGTSKWTGVYQSGLLPVLVAVLMLTFGYFNMQTVHATTYRIHSAKLAGDYRIVFLSDIHYGTVQDKGLLDRKVREINALSPDLVILGGDLLDESATKGDMTACFAALGKLEARYATFYVYGNHDSQKSIATPAYTDEELKQAIVESGIQILHEDLVQVGADLQILGRADHSDPENRKENWAVDPNRFLLVADHQPFGAAENALLGADLQLSGHTHSGQIFPLGLFPFLYEGYVYGRYAVEDMTLLVSSGFAGWGFPVRTQGICEYLVVELSPA